MVVADTAFISTYEAENPDYTCVDTTRVSPTPGIGWTYSSTTGFTAPPPPPPPPTPATLVANPATIPHDGVTASAVTWTAAEGAVAPASVTFNVNGALTTEPTANNSATINVTSTMAGDTVIVKCEGLTTNVSVT